MRSLPDPDHHQQKLQWKPQYLVWPPFASRSATHLLHIELIRLLIVECWSTPLQWLCEVAGYTLSYTPIQSIPNMLNGWHVQWVCWPCKNWDVFSFQELCNYPCNMGVCIIRPFVYIEKVLDLWVQLMKNGGKNKSVAFIILFSMCVCIYIYHWYFNPLGADIISGQFANDHCFFDNFYINTTIMLICFSCLFKTRYIFVAQITHLKCKTGIPTFHISIFYISFCCHHVLKKIKST